MKAENFDETALLGGNRSGRRRISGYLQDYDPASMGWMATRASREGLFNRDHSKGRASSRTLCHIK